MDPDADLILDNHQAEVSATLMYVIEGVVLGIVSFLGVTGNICLYVILLRTEVRKNFHNLLLLLNTFEIVREREVQDVCGFPPDTRDWMFISRRNLAESIKFL